MDLDNHFFQHMEKKKRKRDVIKLFVGQIPSTIDEPSLGAFLSDYVTILDVTILRDRKTNMNKRCAFVYVESHDAANTLISSLSEKFYFPNMRTPVHIDYANTHGTSKQSASTHEQFSINKSPFPNNQHTLSSRSPTETDYTHDQANNSIPKSTNLASPTNMKMFPLHAQEVESDSGNSKSSYSANAPAVLSLPPQGNGSLSSGTYPESVSSSPRYIQPSQNMVMIPPSASSISLSPSVYPVPINQITQPTNGAGSTILFPPCLYTPFAVPQNVSNLSSLPIPTYPNVFMVPRPTSQGIVLPLMMPDRVAPVPISSSQGQESEGIRMVSDISGFHQEGPMGANVFVYHIPSSVDDEMLRELFLPFGTILSTKVYIDTVTQQSRGFGFVSYSTVAEADRAIAAMNGFTVNGKQLKVQKKKEKQHYPINYTYNS